jgi:hypothetical protein
MSLLNSIAAWWMKKRIHQIELFMKYPYDVQAEWLRKLISAAKDTEWGRKYDYASMLTLDHFRERVPIQDYDSLKPYIERVRRGEQNIIWPTEIKWFAKSSGTTSDKSKFLPVSTESLEECHYNGGKDMVAIHCNNNPDTQLFTGKNLALGGSHSVDHFGSYESYHGDVSAIIIQNLPFWAEFLRAPDLSIALMNEWEEKLEKLARATMNENITSMAGVPSWLLILMKRILEITGKSNIKEVWPNFEVYFHGGVSFGPYKEQFVKIFGQPIDFLEIYNASEGFFGIQDQKNSDEMLLMLDYGIFYEFLPMEELEKENGRTLSLDEVKLNTNYAMIISSNAGLWRYKIGDTIKFTSLHPFRFRITGRTKHFINAFGEEVIVDNADNALKVACEKTGAIVKEYTAAPVYMSDESRGAHEWIIEFEKEPADLDYFTDVLDTALKSINSDYEAKRYRDIALTRPVIHSVKEGTFYNWLKTKGKLGGQHKVPRLSNDRKYIEEVLALKA